MAEEYYLISDLHIGGDAALDICDFETELIEFLKELEKKGRNTELIIIGDLFGFWEITGVEGTGKLTSTIGKHGELFEQFRKTGNNITITVIPGNHDYLLACDSAFIRLLAKYNIVLEPEEHIVRKLDGTKIWIEHGSQHDGFNRAAKFGDPYVTPIGFYVTRHITSTAGRHADYGRGNWLKDLESVQPYEHIPDWFLSNYFYREMSPFLRWTLLPFLFFFTISLLAFVGMILEQKAILGTHIFNLKLLTPLGIFGKLFGIILMVDAVIVFFLLLLSIPFWFIYRDIRKMLRRYGLKAKDRINIQKIEAYLKAAREVFARDPAVGIYVFGHTHTPFLRRIDERIIINTGTWLKRLTRIKAWGRLLPDIYYPTFSLNYFRIHRREGRVVIDYELIPRETPSGLTLLQRFLILGRKRKVKFDIPARTILSD
jgi:UDP-2,3-diacylglucosamine pyrophosphatase LpxH